MPSTENDNDDSDESDSEIIDQLKAEKEKELKKSDFISVLYILYSML